MNLVTEWEEHLEVTAHFNCIFNAITHFYSEEQMDFARVVNS